MGIFSRKPKESQNKKHRRIYYGDVKELKDERRNSKSVRSRSVTLKRSPSGRLKVDEETGNGLYSPSSTKGGASGMSSGEDVDFKKPKSHITHHFVSNRIISSKYTAWNFIPKNLFEQFRRIVNFYFLCMAIIQNTIDSPVSPATSALPLIFVIFVTALKQGYEDWLRHKADKQVNNRLVRIVRNGDLEYVKSKDLKVGDILKLDGEEQVPADLILMGSSDEFLRCQITTANLDGETNLKIRYCPSGLPHLKNERDCNKLHLILECEEPNADLYSFNGSIFIPPEFLVSSRQSMVPENEAILKQIGNNKPGSPNGSARPSLKASQTSRNSNGTNLLDLDNHFSIPLSIDNLILRGTKVKNTDWIYGLVIYTGQDTRLAQNSKQTSNKFSTVEKKVNKYLLVFILILLTIVIISTVLHFYYQEHLNLGESTSAWYLGASESHYSQPSAKYVFNVFTSFLILYNYIIPISLYVTMELQKFIGSKFFVWDEEMRDPVSGQTPVCNTSDLNEELGQIEYLFSDKTGTLTENIMKFRYCSVGTIRLDFHESKLYKLNFEEREQIEYSLKNNPQILHFFRVLALCHTVQVVPFRKPSDINEDGLGKNLFSVIKKGKKNRKGRDSTNSLSVIPEALKNSRSNKVFQASSPDEKALIEACEELGVLYIGEKEDVLTLEVFGKKEKYKRHLLFEFDADRKCMSVILENSAGEIWLYTKGAESTVVPNSDSGPSEVTMKNVVDFAVMGMRTLVVAEKRLSREALNEINLKLRRARRLLNGRDEKIREIYREAESHLTVLGATGVEDQLQEGVPETLQALVAAGIHIWMLTGDKLETGVNVAISCGLISKSSKQFIITNMSTAQDINQRLEELEREIVPDDNTTLVIDGESLTAAFNHNPETFRRVAMKSFRVVCCRMAPLQKAKVVHMVKSSPTKPITAAVGDGANDVAMIHEAHIGLGIFGKEGRQAARSSDFALHRFCFLKKSILVHGNWYYVRLSNLAIYFFYKNIVFILPQFLYCFETAFSTQSLYDGYYLMMFNIFFTSCPIFVYGLLEQSYPKQVLLDNPHLYKEIARNKIMTWKNFGIWALFAVFHALIIYYFSRGSWTLFDPNTSRESFGTLVYIGVIIICNLKIVFETNFFAWLCFGAQVVSFGSFFIMTSLYSEVDMRAIWVDPGEFRGVYFKIMSQALFWITILLVTITALLPDTINKVFYQPTKSVAKKWPNMKEAEEETAKTRTTGLALLEFVMEIFKIKRPNRMTQSNQTDNENDDSQPESSQSQRSSRSPKQKEKEGGGKRGNKSDNKRSKDSDKGNSKKKKKSENEDEDIPRKSRGDMSPRRNKKSSGEDLKDGNEIKKRNKLNLRESRKGADSTTESSSRSKSKRSKEKQK